jgi:hypothetical protein
MKRRLQVVRYESGEVLEGGVAARESHGYGGQKLFRAHPPENGLERAEHGDDSVGAPASNRDDYVVPAEAMLGGSAVKATVSRNEPRRSVLVRRPPFDTLRTKSTPQEPDDPHDALLYSVCRRERGDRREGFVVELGVAHGAVSSDHPELRFGTWCQSAHRIS